ncbi:hypothetical protein [Rhizobium ruizarguesonis]|uniref:hypothetical protein n=1 Tax=Rhizobium ruizarguesonis TaxID=2081791 RepID=UPI001446D7F4|nr:hypothetical protein [Rhizobium ruizarguesonis]NKQ85521.1 hypothetical protein [Rhizobium ruizarguesonis]
MKRIFLQWSMAATAAIVLCLANSAPAFSAKCQPNSVQGVASTGNLVVSEIALTKQFDACPSSAAQQTIEVAAQQQIFVWLRLEGDERFAKSARASDEFSIRLHRVGTLREHWTDLELNNTKLTIPAVREEAALPGNSGFFDWRIYADIKAYLVPGTYQMFVSYGRNRVCPAKGRCEIVFAVKRGE